ncbi:MAG TPA: hemerythrin domain-containing protein, partial [Blastocatellia bacterium]|nr:hemerythrin domain-containing protein [Blastocatellia bacterium]
LNEAIRTHRGPLTPPFKSSCSPLQAIAIEHHEIVETVGLIRRMTSSWPPVDGAGLDQSAFRLAVDALDRDLRDHVHLEEIVLFPRAVEIEKALYAGAA